jgi:NADPH:quinone reductase-like Zn-dependent oxidoreductase
MPFDALLNFAAVDTAHVAALVPLIRDGGVLVSATTKVEGFATPRITAAHFVVRNDTDHLTALVNLIDAGAVRIDIAASRPLRELPQVHDDAESGRLPGKTILLPGKDPS